MNTSAKLIVIVVLLVGIVLTAITLSAPVTRSQAKPDDAVISALVRIVHRLDSIEKKLKIQVPESDQIAVVNK